MNSRIPVIVASLFLAAGSVACKHAAEKTADASENKSPIAVQTAVVSEVEVPSTLRLTGSLKGFRETDLAANANGRVTSTSVERGATVTAGQVLAVLDTRAAALTASAERAAAETMTAQEVQSKAECDRYQKLKEKGAISDLEYDRIATTCRTAPLNSEAARARAQLAAQNVGDGVIRAPFPGLVSERYVEVGQYVRQDTRVVSLASLDPLRLEMAVPEANVATIKEGAEVSFHVAAYPDRLFKGKIRFVSGAVRSTTRDLVVEALVDNADKVLLPGMFADVELTTGTRKLPGVPKNAVLDKDGKANVFVVVEGKLEQRVLALGPDTKDGPSVTRGIAVGEKVVTDNLKSLSNGQPVL